MRARAILFRESSPRIKRSRIRRAGRNYLEHAREMEARHAALGIASGSASRLAAIFNSVGFLRVVETSVEARTIQGVVKRHGACSPFQRSIVRIGLETAEIRVDTETHIAPVGGSRRAATALCEQRHETQYARERERRTRLETHKKDASVATV